MGIASLHPSYELAVIASAAKQSIFPHETKTDCFAALAMTWKGRSASNTPTYTGYEDSLASRKIGQAWQHDRGFTNASHAHVKGHFRAQIDND